MLAGTINAAEATRLAQINANKTRVWREESKQKISAAHKGNTYRKGGVVSEEAKKRMSASAKKERETRVYSDEMRRKLSEAGKRGGGKQGSGWKLTPENRASQGAGRAFYKLTLISPSGFAFVITNLNAFCKEHKFCRETIVAMLNGKQPKQGKLVGYKVINNKKD
jgi:hypothetical protein